MILAYTERNTPAEQPGGRRNADRTLVVEMP